MAEEDGLVSFYVLTVMFLCISNAVFIFTAMLRPSRVYFSLKGVPNIMYIDNQLVLAKDEEQCDANHRFAVEVLGKTG